MRRHDFTHMIDLPVRWGDMDAFGHVNNVQYVRYLESGRIAYVEEVMQTPLEEHERKPEAGVAASLRNQTN